MSTGRGRICPGHGYPDMTDHASSPRSFRQSMAGLHTWAGLLSGWLCFTIFLFGTTAFFQQEISSWMRPEISRGTVTAEALDAASAYLARAAPDAERWSVTLPSPRGGEPLALSWKANQDGSGTSGKATLDPVSGRELAVRDTQGGRFLYRFHFDLYYMPVLKARLVVSLAALAMLVTILAGVITHKKIFADFFLLRFGKGQRSWLDAHNVTGVLALPFHLMMTYTGLVALLFTLMPWAITAHFPDQNGFFEAAFLPGPAAKASGKRVQMPSFTMLVAQGEKLAHVRVGLVVVHHPGDASAIAQISPTTDRLGDQVQPLYLYAATGALLQPAALLSKAVLTWQTMVDLHAARFGGPVLRWLYFLSGLAGTMMAASGLVLWTVKRRAKLPFPARPHFGFRLVERLNIGVIAGSFAGIAVYFLANRLLPLDIANRADWEINALFIAWGGLFIWTLARSTKRAWVEALAACAALFALVPAVNALTTDRGLIRSLLGRDWVFAGFDLVMLAMAAACAFTAWKVRHHKANVSPRGEARELAGAIA